MDLTNKKQLQSFFSLHSISPKKSLGQNFLIDKHALNAICYAANLSKEDVVIDIGAGTGTLTRALAEKVRHVIAVEKDKKLIPLLCYTLKNYKNVDIVGDDILNFSLPDKDYKVVSNLPYYITSPIIRKLLEQRAPPSLMVFTLQKEVAIRIIARPPKMNLLAVCIQALADPEIIRDIPPASFWPAPKITSSVLRLTPHNRYGKNINKKFFAVLRAGYAHPRKKLIKNLSLLDKRGIKRIELKNGNSLDPVFEKADIDTERRAESLSVKEWVKLTRILAEND